MKTQKEWVKRCEKYGLIGFVKDKKPLPLWTKRVLQSPISNKQEDSTSACWWNTKNATFYDKDNFKSLYTGNLVPKKENQKTFKSSILQIPS